MTELRFVSAEEAATWPEGCWVRCQKGNDPVFGMDERWTATTRAHCDYWGYDRFARLPETNMADTRSVDEFIRDIRAAGGDAWDDVEDPGAFLRQMRGDLTWSERFADLTLDQLHDVRQALNEAFRAKEEGRG